MEYSGLDPDLAFSRRCRNLGKIFISEVMQAVNELKLIMPATAEAASALTMASNAAAELCKPHLAMLLSSRAASMVITLGYHRLSTMQADTEYERQSKMLVFWMAYWLDASFSIRFGHQPVIRDYDITVPMIAHGSMIPASFVDGFNYCTQMSGLQCQVVEQLYSPLALRQSAEERAKRASTLTAKLQEAWDTRDQVRRLRLVEEEDLADSYS